MGFRSGHGIENALFSCRRDAASVTAMKKKSKKASAAERGRAGRPLPAVAGCAARDAKDARGKSDATGKKVSRRAAETRRLEIS